MAKEICHDEPLSLRDDYCADDLRRFVKRCRDAKQNRRLLSLAAMYDGMDRGSAASGSVSSRGVRIHYFARFDSVADAQHTDLHNWIWRHLRRADLPDRYRGRIGDGLDYHRINHCRLARKLLRRTLDSRRYNNPRRVMFDRFFRKHHSVSSHDHTVDAGSSCLLHHASSGSAHCCRIDADDTDS